MLVYFKYFLILKKGFAQNLWGQSIIFLPVYKNVEVKDVSKSNFDFQMTLKWPTRPEELDMPFCLSLKTEQLLYERYIFLSIVF